MPWASRQMMSHIGVVANPATAVAMTKITRLIWMSIFLSRMSASLPQIGVEIAIARKFAVTTQV